jgi:hypothetical protein
MKRILALMVVFFTPLPALATAMPPAEQPTETAEVITIAAGTVSGLFNAALMVEGSPSYLAAATGIGLGVAALALTAAEHPAHETGLFAAGSFAIATGLIAVWNRHVLDKRAGQARIAPTWNGGAPGVALVVDF